MPIITNPFKKINARNCLRTHLSSAIALLFVFTIISCGTVYDKTAEIENGRWSDNNTISFEFEIKDTTQLYDIFLEVNHNTNYPYQNIYCLVETFELENAIRKDQCSLELADSKGNWLGECNNQTCDRKIPFIINTQFNSVGIHKIILTQNTRNTILNDVNSLRLWVTKAT